MPESTKAVFLSYASQDAEVAMRMAEALRRGEVEVWLDQEGGLVGGDAWDRKIREQINSCALFIPIVSANTQARKEGYFRLEWHLAEERARLIAKGVPFIVPVSVDGTTERGALVPDAFTAVQWTRLPGGEAPAAFVARVRKLLGAPSAESTTTTRPLDRGQAGLTPAPTQSSAVSAKNLELSTDVRGPLEGGFETFVPQRSLLRRALPVAAAMSFGVLLTVAVGWRLWPTAAPTPVTRFSFHLPEGQRFRSIARNVIAVSPDGRRLVLNVGPSPGGLFLRSLDELEAHVIPGTELNLTNPFFSPDGQSVGYAQDRQLKRVAISGGTSVVICDLVGNAIGASWAPDGTILFGQPEGILRVPSTGGKPAVVIAAQNGAQLGSPQLLPDGDTVLFTERPAGSAAIDGARIVAQKISTGARKVLVEGGVDARFLATGHLVYAVGNVLMGVAFDARRLAVIGGAVPVVQGVTRSASGSTDAAYYSVAADGTLVWVYSAASVGSNASWQLGLSDRAGKVTSLALPPGPYDTTRVSPDGTCIAMDIADPKGAYIAIYDLDGKTALRRLTFGGNNRYPVWSRDGQRVTFQSDRDGDPAIFWQLADGTGPAERLTKPEKDTTHVPSSWSLKDETLLFTVVKVGAARGAIWTYARASGTAAPFGGVKNAQESPVFSPDGRWVAYASREEGDRFGLYVQPFPATGAKFQLPLPANSVQLTFPLWSPDGTALFFSPGPNQLAVAAVTTRPTFAVRNSVGVPRSFAGNMVSSPTAPRGFDIMPDGRFIALFAPGTAADAVATATPEIRIAEHWTEELKRLVPVK